MKKILLFLTLIILIGCHRESREYSEFVETYGNTTRTFCEGNFKMRETFLSPEATKPQTALINSQDCN